MLQPRSQHLIALTLKKDLYCFVVYSPYYLAIEEKIAMRLSETKLNSHSAAPAKLIGLVVLILALVVLAGCGGSNSTRDGSSNPLNTAFQLNVGDDPSDRVAALLVNISSVTLTNSSGGTVSVLASPTSVEFMHLMGALQSLSLVNVPQDTYTKATITIASATVTYLNPATGQLTQQTITGPWNADMNFSPPLTVSSGSVTLNLHLDVEHSVSIDGSGNVLFTPKFTSEIFHGGSGDDHNRQRGGLDHLAGTVSSISGSSFVLTMMQSPQAVTVKTDSHTEFEGIGGIGALTVGMIVKVDADLQSDGSLLAREVSLMNHDSNGMEAEGLIVSVAGSPATQLTVIAHDGAGSGMSHDDLGGTITVNLDTNTAFSIRADHVDLTGLPFTPTFTSTSVFKGQNVEVVSSSGMGHDSGSDDMHRGTANASEVHLDQQGLRGTVANYSPNGTQATFTLSVAADSLFASLTGATSVTVYQQADTELWGSGTLTNGATVEVRGLLFVDSGAYKLVAGRILVH